MSPSLWDDPEKVKRAQEIRDRKLQARIEKYGRP